MSTVLDMTLTEEDAKLLAECREAVQKHEADLGSQIEVRDYVIRGAVKHGASLREIAEVAGISYQRVAQIVGAK